MNKKKCLHCEEIKDLSLFGNLSKSIDGKHYYCKKCLSDINKANYQKNRKDILEKRVVYNNENKDSKKSYDKDYRDKNKEVISIKDKARRENNKSEIKTRGKAYRKNNPEKIREYKRGYEKKRIAEDPNFKFKKTARRRILNALKKQNTFKQGSTVSLLGCTIQEARTHIEKSFTEGMTWNNHGVWEIDHIIPCASFDLTNTEQQKKCFNYTNLQALWAIDNKLKSDKIV